LSAWLPSLGAGHYGQEALGWAARRFFRGALALAFNLPLPVFDTRVTPPSAAARTLALSEGIWLVSFMHSDLRYFDLEQKTLQPLDNPFGTRLSPMS
jgi:hypothetical protein